MPYSTSEVDECNNHWTSFSAGVSAELFYWFNASTTPPDEEEKKHDRYENTGIYSKKT
jgi:hypothetical protein